jgi:hypothetical protein
VASMLLSIVALTVATTTRGTLALTTDAARLAHAQALGTSRAEAAASQPCPSFASGRTTLPGIALSWQQARSATLLETRLDIAITRSPLAFSVEAAPLTIVTARSCP